MAISISGLSLLCLAAYGEAALIVVLVVVVVWLYIEATRLYDLYTEAQEVCAEVRATLLVMQRMKRIRAETLARMRRASR